MRRFLYVALMAIALALTLLATNLGARSLAQLGEDGTPFPIALQTYPQTVTPCPLGLPPTEVPGTTVTCGYLTVPENYAIPNGRQIELSYAVLHSRRQTPLAEPVVFLHGGPGSSLIDSLDNTINADFEPFLGLYEPLRQRRDVVLFDQRGSKFSNRLGCAPFFLGIRNLRTQVASLDQLFRRLEAVTGDTPLGTNDILGLHVVCAIALQNHGADLNQYNTPNHARDTVNLLTSLGYREFNLYGISYGTRLAQQLMRDYPDRVRSVVLDSALPYQADVFALTPRFFEAALLNAIADCDVDADCAAAFPNLQARTVALVNSLGQNPIPVMDAPLGIAAQVTPASIAQLVGYMNQQPQLSRYLPLIIHELEQGITTTYTIVTTPGFLTQTVDDTVAPNPFEASILRARDLQVAINRQRYVNTVAAQTQRPAFQWLRQVTQAIEAFAPGQKNRSFFDLSTLGYEFGKRRDRDALRGFVDRTFEGAQADDFRTQIDQMSPVEIRNVYFQIEQLNDVSAPRLDIADGLSRGVHYSIVCRELMAFNNIDATLTTFESLTMPGLSGGAQFLISQRQAVCSIWPVEPAPADEHTVIESDIPTLVLGGRYDTQTPNFMAIQAVEGLSRATFVEMPNSGHGTFGRSQCARDISTAFINRPDEAPDTSCTETLKPQFILLPASPP
ncbi:MAG: alpha/beta fold hydrolase [Cyanobacteria bacterium P01_F01_bin.56]